MFMLFFLLHGENAGRKTAKLNLSPFLDGSSLGGSSGAR